jgi:acyl-CoA synthetase (AMP-forming)/AMP-acid ligase II
VRDPLTAEHLTATGSTAAEMPPRFDRLSDFIPHYGERNPERPALVAGERVVSWGELPGRIDDLAAALLRHGVSKGDRVGVWSPPSIEGILVFMACARLGATYVGLNPKYQLDEVLTVLSDSSPKVVFAAERTADRDYRAELAEIPRRGPVCTIVTVNFDKDGTVGTDAFVGELAGGHHDAVAELATRVQPTDPIALVYTSGSSGKPKGALLTQQGFAHNYWRAFGERRMEYLKTPAFFTINHLAGLGDVAAMAFVAGGTQYFMQKFDSEALVSLIERERITYLPGLVTHLQMLVRDVEDLESRDLSSLEYIWWGGALMPPELLRRLQAICPRASTDFGQTETHGPLIYTPQDATIEQKVQTIGRIDDANAVRIYDNDERRVCEPGEPGEVQAHGTQTSPGYWGNPAASAELYTEDGWLRTGDLAMVREDGYVVMVGRLSEMFKSGGYNIYPAEIEAALLEHPAIDMVAVVSVPDPLYQEVGIAFVTLKSRAAITAEELQAHARSKLANYKIPKRFHICEALPQTVVGKIDKPRLKKFAAEGRDDLAALRG